MSDTPNPEDNAGPPSEAAGDSQPQRDGIGEPRAPEPAGVFPHDDDSADDTGDDDDEGTLVPRSFPPQNPRERIYHALPTLGAVLTGVGLVFYDWPLVLGVGVPATLWTLLVRAGLFGIPTEHKTREIREMPAALHSAIRDLEDNDFDIGDTFTYEGVVDIDCAIAMHAHEPILGMAIRAQDKVGIDVVSLFGEEMESPSLTTSNLLDGGSAPRPAYAMAQILVDERVYGLLEAHRSALIGLGEQGLHPAPVLRGDFKRMLYQSLDKQRMHICRRPFAYGSVAVARTLLKRSPHMRPLLEQPRVQKWLKRRRG